MKIKLFIALTTIATASLLMTTSCENNSKEVLFSCDSVNVSYSKVVKPILDAQCNSCHSTANAPTLGSNYVLDNYNDVMTWVDTTSVANGGDGGRLLNDVKHNTNPMPKNANKLSVCDIAKIEHWIFEGAMNN
jgi:hypothetical protein